MGLGLYLSADLPRKGWFRRSPGRDDVFKAVTATIRTFVERQPAPLKGWISESIRDGVLRINLIPFEEDIEFSVTEERIICSAKTSTAGPGYHAYLTELLEELKRIDGLAWNENSEDSQDETGFYTTRDFKLLQRSMADWLHFVAKHVLEEMKGYDPPILLGMPIGFAPRTPAFVVSPMGEWSRDWLADAAAADGARLLSLASEFFSWWDQGLSASNLRNFGLVRCWMDIGWTAPRNFAERELLESTLASFDAAVSLDPSIKIPAETEELRRLLAKDAPVVEPKPSGIGFLRRTMRLPLPGGWTIDLPGYFRSELEDDGTTQVYFFPGKTVRGGSVSLKGPDGASAADLLRGMTEKSGENPLAIKASHLAGKYHCEWSAQEQCHVLQATVAKVDGFCVVTVCFDLESDRAWAESVVATIYAPPPSTES